MSKYTQLATAAQKAAATAAQVAADPRTYQTLQAVTGQPIQAQRPLPLFPVPYGGQQGAYGPPTQSHQQQAYQQQQQQQQQSWQPNVPQGSGPRPGVGPPRAGDGQRVAAQQEAMAYAHRQQHQMQQFQRAQAAQMQGLGEASIASGGAVGADWAEKIFWKSPYGRVLGGAWILSALGWLAAVIASVWIGSKQGWSSGGAITAYVIAGILTLVLIILAVVTAYGKKRVREGSQKVQEMGRAGLGFVTGVFGGGKR